MRKCTQQPFGEELVSVLIPSTVPPAPSPAFLTVTLTVTRARGNIITPNVTPFSLSLLLLSLPLSSDLNCSSSSLFLLELLNPRLFCLCFCRCCKGVVGHLVAQSWFSGLGTVFGLLAAGRAGASVRHEKPPFIFSNSSHSQVAPLSRVASESSIHLSLPFFPTTSLVRSSPIRLLLLVLSLQVHLLWRAQNAQSGPQSSPRSIRHTKQQSR
mmetsp:Transcript_11289/g.23088  ORF Transcript_11289/g.23088 Transcript_11289/m.23088 type:complete len:212 (-) Transcript_11289:633-1268(-)